MKPEVMKPEVREPEKEYWLDNPRNVTKIIYAVYLVCALLASADLLYDKEDIHFEFEKVFGFFGFFGFLACVALVLSAKLMRLVVRREEDYYD